MLQRNDMIELSIDSLTNEGNGVGKYEGMAIFVPDTAPGDRVLAKVVKPAKSYAYGRLERVISPSKSRVEPDCPVARSCGGCALRHLSYPAEKEQKRRQVEDAFKRIGGFDIPCRPLIATDVIDGYRNKAMLPVRRKGARVQMGFYQKRSHDVIDHTDCRLQPPEFHQIAQAVRGFIMENDLSCYDESSGKGVVRHLYLRRGAVTGEIMVCLVINAGRLPHADALLTALERLKLPIASVSININQNNTNVILGDKTRTLWGAAHIFDRLCGVQIALSPESFYQVNHDAAELLYGQVLAYAGLSGRETLLDLYCGAGTIGLSLAGHVKQVIGVEVVTKAVEDARRNAKENHITNAEFICADATQAAARLASEGVEPEVIVVDPPRKGCDEAVLAAIAKMAPQRVVMVSCNPATAARDCKRLAELGFLPQEVTPFDLFPRTTHVECVVWMTRTAR